MMCVKCKQEIDEDSTYCKYCAAPQTVQNKKYTRLRPNGTGTAYKRGKTWTAVLCIGWKLIEGEEVQAHFVPLKRTKGGFKTKRDALEYIPNLRGKKILKDVVTLSSIYGGWSTSALLKLSKSKQTAYRIAYEKLDDIVRLDISTLKIEDLQNQIDEKAETFYPARDMKSLLSHLYKRAMAQEDVHTNLAQFIVLPELEEIEPKAFNKGELKAIWEAYGAGNKLAGYVLLMIYSGMMPGELLIAEKNMIDWDKQTIIGCGLKTKKRKSTPIVIADLIIPVLQDLCMLSENLKLLSMDRKKFYPKFKELMKQCGCEDGHTPYSCRHTTATALALGNIAPSVIQEVMRHTKFTTTQRYIHVDSIPMLDAVNKIKGNL